MVVIEKYCEKCRGITWHNGLYGCHECHSLMWDKIENKQKENIELNQEEKDFYDKYNGKIYF